MSPFTILLLRAKEAWNGLPRRATALRKIICQAMRIVCTGAEAQVDCTELRATSTLVAFCRSSTKDFWSSDNWCLVAVTCTRCV